MKFLRRILQVFALILAPFYFEIANAQEVDEIIRNKVELVRFQDTFLWNEKLVCDQSLFTFYQLNQFNAAWSNEKNVEELLEVLKSADEHGLTKEDYHYLLISKIWNRQKDKMISKHVQADFDIVCTDAYLLLAGHLLSGKVDPTEFDANWYAVKNEGLPSEILREALKSGIKASIENLLPRDQAYHELMRVLTEYEEISAAGGWGKVNMKATKIEKGYKGSEIPEIRRRLSKSGDFEGDLFSDIYSDSLEMAVKSFQGRHGLQADGVIGANTIAALNVPVQDRIDQIKINLERFRWMKRDLGSNYIMVNIANFELSIFESSQRVMQKRVVVGKSYRMTPVFSSTMRYLVLNPDWTVPPTILKNDILAVAKKDPSVIERKKLKIIGQDGKVVDPGTVDWTRYPEKPFPYTLKQDPGPDNALGLVKFIFPNTFNVYLHDTPQRDLFDKPERALSSGCIRVEKPLELAEYVLKDKAGWDKSKIESVVASKKSETVFLNREINVHLQYFTAWVNENGEIQFRKDIYSRDSLVYTALNQHLDTISLINLNR